MSTITRSSDSIRRNSGKVSLFLAALLFLLLSGGCAHVSPSAALSGGTAGTVFVPDSPPGGADGATSAPTSVSRVTSSPGLAGALAAGAPSGPSVAADVVSGPPALSSPPAAAAIAEDLEEGYEDDGEDEGEEDREEIAAVDDPLEPFNRAMFTFNDRLYFWVLKPVSKGYNFVVPEDVRISIRNVFRNIAFPVRFVNCLLQANLGCAGTEVGRFLINSTFGIGGLFDVAATEAFNLPRQEIELSQTLGLYGWEDSVYINWPFIGPSSPRDTIGLTGDILLDPLAWLQPWYLSRGVAAYYKLNNVSLSIGDYEALKEAAIDPYVAVRDAYIQHRRQFIKKARQEQAGMQAPSNQKIPPPSDPQRDLSD